MCHEFGWQRGAEQNAAAYKKEALVPSSRLRIFAFVQANSPVLQFVHTLGKFFDIDTAPQLRGKVIAFVGDKRQYSARHPVVLPEQNTWE